MAIDTTEFAAPPLQPEVQDILDENVLSDENRPGLRAKIGLTVAAFALAVSGFALNGGEHHTGASQSVEPAVQTVGSDFINGQEQLEQAEAYAEQQKEVGDYLAAVAAQQAADAQAKAEAEAAAAAQAQADVAAATQQAANQEQPTYVGGGGTDNNFLECVKQRESGGNYNIHNEGGSGAGGAYQMMPGTWNSIAASSGREDLVGVDPAQASPADQDAMAQALYAQQGTSPWAGGSYEC